MILDPVEEGEREDGEYYEHIVVVMMMVRVVGKTHNNGGRGFDVSYASHRQEREREREREPLLPIKSA